MQVIMQALRSSLNRGQLDSLTKNTIPISGDINKNEYTQLLSAIGNASVVMIGEASHGTDDFYAHRAAITRKLIEEKGFNMVVVEADWPDAYRINRYVRNADGKKDKNATQALQDFQRFPLWMWRNERVRDFLEWLREHNNQFDSEDKKAGFYGMDLYSWFRSMKAVLDYLKRVSPEDADVVAKRYGRFHRFEGNESLYGYSTEFGYSPSYEKEVVQTLVDLQRKGPEYLQGYGGLIDGDELFYAQRNADLVKCAEKYYRKTYTPGANTWNYRDAHMTDTIVALFEHYRSKGIKPKAVVWAHNSHLGDASKTEAGMRRGEWNVGQLTRQYFGHRDTFNIGFTAFSGSVTAAPEWDSPAHFMKVRNGLYNSWEHLLHEVSLEKKLSRFSLIFRSNDDSFVVDQQMRQIFLDKRLERYIGVIYAAQTERASHYAKSQIGEEFDAIIHIDRANALVPLDIPDRTWKMPAQQYKNTNDPYPEINGFVRGRETSLQERLVAARDLLQVAGEKKEQNQMSEAITIYSKALTFILLDYIDNMANKEVENLRIETLLNKASCHASLEDWNNVIEDCRKILSSDEQNVGALYYLILSLLKKGRVDMAEDYLKQLRADTREYKELGEKITDAKSKRKGFFNFF